VFDSCYPSQLDKFSVAPNDSSVVSKVSQQLDFLILFLNAAFCLILQLDLIT